MGEITDALRRARAEKESAKPDSPPKVAEAFAPEEGLEAGPDAEPPPPRPIAEFTESQQPTASISRDRRGFWQARAVHLDRPGAVAERFRHLAVRVRRELDAISGQTLMVASALRAEGKTVTSCNLALALASMASERRIALVDLDLRRPSVANAMGVRPMVGIESVLSGEASLASARIPTDVPSFDLFLAAKPTRNAHELLATPSLDQILAELRSHYAVVVVDTPPVLLVPDVPLMAPAFDACMVVGRVGKTSQAAFQEMISLLPKDKILGGFLNEVRAAGHAGQYGYYLGDDEEESKPGRDDEEESKPESPPEATRMSSADFDFEDAGSPGLPGFLGDPIGALKRRWLWMVPVLAIGLIGTAWIVLGIQPSYVATATILVRSQQIPEAFVRATVEEDPLQRIDEMVGQVLTRDRINQLVVKHDLYARLSETTERSDIVAQVQENIQISAAPGYSNVRSEGARIFTVAFEYEDPTIAATVANEIAGLLPAESVKNRTRQARLATDFLRRELEAADVTLRQQNAKITEFKERFRGELPAELSANLGKLERLQAQRQSLALQIAESANRVAAFAASPASLDAASGPARLEQLRGELATERASRTDRHPNVVALQDEIRILEATIAANPAPVTSGVAGQLIAAEQVTLRELRSQLRHTESELAALDVSVGRTPARQEELGALEEKATVLRETYLDYLRKVQEAELAQNLEATQAGERVSVLNWATPPTRSVRNPLKYLVAGVLASFLGALGVGVLFEILDPVLVSVRQMESAGEINVLGSVPRIL